MKTYSITVPSNIKGKEHLDLQEKMLQKVLASLSNNFGGATAIEGKGGYTTNNGELIIEKVYQVTSFANQANDKLLQLLARYIRLHMRQESVMYTIDGEPVFI